MTVGGVVPKLEVSGPSGCRNITAPLTSFYGIMVLVLLVDSYAGKMPKSRKITIQNVGRESFCGAYRGVASIGPPPGLRSQNNIQNKKNKKNLNPCHQMLFLGLKYAKIAFAAEDPAGELKRSPEPQPQYRGLLLRARRG